jgi:hypothetical protein
MRDSSVQRSSASLIWASLAILFFVFAMVLMIQIRNLSQARDVDQDLRAEAIAIMTSPDARVISKPKALLIVSRGHRVVLLASQLPRLAPGKTFELWFTPQPSKGITFGGTPSHTVQIVAAAPVGAAALIVTIEDEAGASAPTTAPVLTMPLESTAP